MIPIVSLGNFISFLAYFFVTTLTYFSWRRKKIELSGYFLRCFAIFTAWFLIISFPGFLFYNPVLIGVIFLTSYIFSYPLIASFVLVIFHLLNMPKLKNAVLLLFLALQLVTFYIGIVGFKPARAIVQEGYIYWLPDVNPIIRITIGLTSVFFGAAFIILFLIMGKRSGERKVFARAVILGSGMLSVIIASFINYIGGAVPSPATFLAAGVFAVLSAFLFLGGVLYKV